MSVSNTYFLILEVPSGTWSPAAESAALAKEGVAFTWAQSGEPRHSQSSPRRGTACPAGLTKAPSCIPQGISVTNVPLQKEKGSQEATSTSC